MMRQLVAIAFLLMCFANAEAQQWPRRSQFMVNPYLANPAAAGISRDIPIYTSYRSQWNSLSVHPQTFYLSAQKNIPGGFGAGMLLTNDQTGAYSNTSMELTGAFHANINRTQTVSFGLGLIGTQHVFDLSEANVVDPNDVALNNGQRQTAFSLNANAGIFVSGKKYFVGISVPYFFNTKMNFTGKSQLQRDVRHFQLMGTHAFKLTKEWELSPGFMVRLTGNTPPQIELNAMLNYERSLYGGFTYRPGDSWAALLGWRFEGYSLWYSYDLTTGKAHQLALSTHEITIGYNLKARRGFKPGSVGTGPRKTMLTM